MSLRLDWTEFPARREVEAHPGVFNAERFPLGLLREAIQRSQPLFRGWPFLMFDPHDRQRTRVVKGGLDTVVDNRSGGSSGFAMPRVEQWTLLPSGTLLHRTALVEDCAPAEKSILRIADTVYHVAEAVGS